MMLDLVIFYSLVEFGLAYQIANFIGYASGTLLSFGLQRKFTFRIKDRTIFRLILFFIIKKLFVKKRIKDTRRAPQ